MIRRQVDFNPLHPHRTAVAIAFETAKAQGFSQWRGLAAVQCVAPQNGPHPRQQFARLKRFGDIVIGPHLQPHDAIHRVPFGGQHQDGRQAFIPLERADAAAHFQAIGIGQHHIQDHQVGAPTVCQVAHALGAGAGV